MDTSTQGQEILNRVSATENLPSLPAAAIEVLQLSKRGDASVEELAEVIQQDPALTAKLLKVVNSSMFGLSREISSIQQAVGLLGLRAVTVLALSFSLVETIDSKEQDGFDYQAFWRHSLTTGVLGRLLGKQAVPRFAEEAFVAGLLSKVGMISAWKGAPELYQRVLDESRATGAPIVDVEQTQLGFTHAVMTAHLLRNWSLPGTICDAIEAHRGEVEPENKDGQELGRLVRCAARLADLFCQEVASNQLDLICDEIVSELGISASSLEEVLDTIEESVRATAASLSVQVGELTNYEQLKTEATVQIAQLSLEAEAERQVSAKREAAAQAETQRLALENQRIQKVAATDGLTGLANRGTFDRVLSEGLQDNAQTGQSLGLIMIDVDHFKQFNDTYGHRAGDAVLQAVATTLSAQVGDLGLAARYGGEEFAAILTNVSYDQAQEVAQNIRKAIAAHSTEWEGQELNVRASLGLCMVDRKFDNLSNEHVIELADKLLYRAKRGGRNRVEAASLAQLIAR